MSSHDLGIRRAAWFLLGAVLALGLLAPESTAAQAQKAAPIRVSYQPATYWSLPFLVATEQGFWAQEGLNPELSPFPSGAPQVDAGAQEAWDVGGMGSAPAVLGASRYGLLTIGITNDESMANAVMVRGDAAATWLKRPARDLRRKTVPLRHAGAPGEDLSHRRVHEAGSGARQVAPLGDQLSITLRIARKPASGDRRGVSSNAWALPIKRPAWSGRGAFWSNDAVSTAVTPEQSSSNTLQAMRANA